MKRWAKRHFMPSYFLKSDTLNFKGRTRLGTKLILFASTISWMSPLSIALSLSYISSNFNRASLLACSWASVANFSCFFGSLRSGTANGSITLTPIFCPYLAFALLEGHIRIRIPFHWWHCRWIRPLICLHLRWHISRWVCQVLFPFLFKYCPSFLARIIDTSFPFH